MRYVMEAIFRPFMNWFESMGIPGLIFPMAAMTIFWIMTSLRRFISRRSTWRDWMATIGFVGVLLGGCLAIIMGQTSESRQPFEEIQDQRTQQQLQDINPEDIEGPWRRITPKEKDETYEKDS